MKAVDSAAHVIMTVDDLVKLAVNVEEARCCIDGVANNTAFRASWASPAPRQTVITRRLQQNIMDTLVPAHLPPSAGLMRCSNGHHFFLEDRLREANSQQEKCITCGTAGCNQRVPFGTLRTLNLSLITEGLLMGVDM